ncbi:ABC transporter substrate-binding protein [Natronorubrum aibiense]|uniref:ABC transporter substrate-binding protein n=1 Tax=Natronorubrum aibiense TaxID=348826 RepID=A0A5P9P9Q1_9EURY|nr:ABC transporter substrate-binding protein [Natronorubrum aibiense]QFU84824.1 ABC transporter substrate-binding protein [Natronorubrum aibiense]
MVDKFGEIEATTRRRYLKHGGTLIGSVALAGCSDLLDEEGEKATESTGGAYEACLFPVGCREFERVPESVTTYNMGWADMVISLGHGEKLRTNRIDAPELFYEPFGLDLDPDWPALWQSSGYSKEVFYELDPDAFLLDPNMVEAWDDNWDESDTEEIESNVAPFFGCHNRRTESDWQHDMGYPENAPSMLETLEILGTVFDERERADAWLTLHEAVQSEVQPRVPPTEDRPSVALINSGSEPQKGTFYVLDLDDPGYEKKSYRDLGAVNAFEGVETGQHGETDYETMLSVDPDIICVHWGITTGSTTFDGDGAFDSEAFREQFIAPMENDPTGCRLTAVQNGRVYPGAEGEQGPLVNLLNTEVTARSLYPGEFGALDLDAPLEVPEEEQLFDRQRIADIINGDS